MKKVEARGANVGVKIKVVLFDFGDVLVNDTEKSFESRHQLRRLPAEKIKHYKKVSDLSEEGRASTAEMLRVTKEVFNLRQSEAQLEQEMLDVRKIKPMWQLFEQIKLLAQKSHGKLKIAIFSNNQRTWPEKMVKRLGGAIKGVKFFNSARIGAHKPEAKAFRIVQKKLGVKPHEIFFIDDRSRNVTSANKIGWKAVRYMGKPGAVKAALKKAGIAVSI